MDSARGGIEPLQSQDRRKGEVREPEEEGGRSERGNVRIIEEG